MAAKTAKPTTFYETISKEGIYVPVLQIPKVIDAPRPLHVIRERVRREDRRGLLEAIKPEEWSDVSEWEVLITQQNYEVFNRRNGRREKPRSNGTAISNERSTNWVKVLDISRKVEDPYCNESIMNIAGKKISEGLLRVHPNDAGLIICKRRVWIDEESKEYFIRKLKPKKVPVEIPEEYESPTSGEWVRVSDMKKRWDDCYNTHTLLRNVNALIKASKLLVRKESRSLKTPDKVVWVDKKTFPYFVTGRKPIDKKKKKPRKKRGIVENHQITSFAKRNPEIYSMLLEEFREDKKQRYVPQENHKITIREGLRMDVKKLGELDELIFQIAYEERNTKEIIAAMRWPEGEAGEKRFDRAKKALRKELGVEITWVPRENSGNREGYYHCDMRDRDKISRILGDEILEDKEGQQDNGTLSRNDDATASEVAQFLNNSSVFERMISEGKIEVYEEEERMLLDEEIDDVTA